jgi:CheY-like chemotaxis protein
LCKFLSQKLFTNLFYFKIPLANVKDGDQQICLCGALGFYVSILPFSAICKALIFSPVTLYLHCSIKMIFFAGFGIIPVTAVANGLQAWDLLEDTRNQFDLVLTEAMGPCLSGIDLLSKIMSHRTYKHIPVISMFSNLNSFPLFYLQSLTITSSCCYDVSTNNVLACAVMSSHDSMILIFKCLTMGAVDFLIKPLRKNELKNIWKHIWKRHQNVCTLFFSLRNLWGFFGHLLQDMYNLDVNNN